MDIQHDTDRSTIFTQIDGHTAYVQYEVKDGTFDILHTIVPHPLEGQGIASMLVKFAYDYALTKGWHTATTCSYAAAWMKRHPEYNQ